MPNTIIAKHDQTKEGTQLSSTSLPQTIMRENLASSSSRLDAPSQQHYNFRNRQHSPPCDTYNVLCLITDLNLLLFVEVRIFLVVQIRNTSMYDIPVSSNAYISTSTAADYRYQVSIHASRGYKYKYCIPYSFGIIRPTNIPHGSIRVDENWLFRFRPEKRRRRNIDYLRTCAGVLLVLYLLTGGEYYVLCIAYCVLRLSYEYA